MESVWFRGLVFIVRQGRRVGRGVCRVGWRRVGLGRRLGRGSSDFLGNVVLFGEQEIIDVFFNFRIFLGVLFSFRDQFSESKYSVCFLKKGGLSQIFFRILVWLDRESLRFLKFWDFFSYVGFGVFCFSGYEILVEVTQFFKSFLGGRVQYFRVE